MVRLRNELSISYPLNTIKKVNGMTSYFCCYWYRYAESFWMPLKASECCSVLWNRYWIWDMNLSISGLRYQWYTAFDFIIYNTDYVGRGEGHSIPIHRSCKRVRCRQQSRQLVLVTLNNEVSGKIHRILFGFSLKY